MFNKSKLFKENYSANFMAQCLLLDEVFAWNLNIVIWLMTMIFKFWNHKSIGMKYRHMHLVAPNSLQKSKSNKNHISASIKICYTRNILSFCLFKKCYGLDYCKAPNYVMICFILDVCIEINYSSIWKNWYCNDYIDFFLIANIRLNILISFDNKSKDIKLWIYTNHVIGIVWFLQNTSHLVYVFSNLDKNLMLMIFHTLECYEIMSKCTLQ